MLDSALEKSEDARLPRESLRQGQEEEGKWEQAILVSLGGARGHHTSELSGCCRRTLAKATSKRHHPRSQPTRVRRIQGCTI